MPTYPAPYQLRLANVTSDIIPSANVTYNLGNTTNSWGSLFLAGNTITLGGAEIKTDSTTGAVAIIPAITESNPSPAALVITANGIGTTTTSNGAVSNSGFSSPSQISGGGGGTSTFTASFKSNVGKQIYLANNVGDGHGIYFRSNSTINFVQLTASVAPQGANVVVTMKKGNTYSTSTSVNTFSLAANSTSTSELTANVSITGGESIFYDITSTGLSVRGSGLNIRTIYTTG